MLTAVDETLSGLRDLRVNAAFDKLLADTEEIVVELDLEALTVPRQRQPPKRYTGDAVPHVAITVSDYYRPLYFELVDTTVQQLENRFHSNASLLKYQALIGECAVDRGMRRCSGQFQPVGIRTYEEIDWADLQVQIELFRRKRSVKSLRDAVGILKGMAPQLRGEYKKVEKLVRLLLVAPASSAEAERSFSALRRLKTWLRSTMTQH